MQIIDCQQGTYDWHALRAGRFTATDAETVKVHGKGLETLSYEIAAFKLTGQLPEMPTSAAMERGKMLEPLARAAYMQATGQEVQEVGFCVVDDLVGCSPDGLVGEKGGLEVKCKTWPHHLWAVVHDWVDPKHYAQVQWNIMVTEREWWDYALFNPDFAPNSLYIKTIKRDEDMIAKLQEGLAIGRKSVQEAMDKFQGVYQI